MAFPVAAPRAVLSKMRHTFVFLKVLSRSTRQARYPLRCYPAVMFVFFSNRIGCLGSIAISIVGTAILVMLMRSCN
jgi:hypothetical protein